MELRTFETEDFIDVATIALLLLVGFTGCGPNPRMLREQTLSALNTEADRWIGKQEFATNATDAYGRPLTSDIEKGTVNYKLTVRSAGPDGLPKNSDDIVAYRAKPHGESSRTEVAAKAVESVAGGAASGTIKGLKKGLGFGGGDENKRSP